MADNLDTTTAPEFPDTACPRPQLKTGQTVKAPAGVHPKSYAMKVDGDCLAPIVRHGETVICEPILPVKGEIAVFYFKGKERGAVKRLAMDFYGFPSHPESELDAYILAEQINPPKSYEAAGKQLDAIHRVPCVLRDDTWVSLRKAVRS